MTNGFYDLKPLNTKSKLIKFYTRAIMLSYRFNIDYLPGISRELDKTMSLEKAFKLVSTSNHNVCIDRIAYNRGAFKESDSFIDVGEVGFSTLRGKSLYLFIFMNRESFETLIKEFNLKLINYESRN